MLPSGVITLEGKSLFSHKGCLHGGSYLGMARMGRGCSMGQHRLVDTSWARGGTAGGRDAQGGLEEGWGKEVAGRENLYLSEVGAGGSP